MAIFSLAKNKGAHQGIGLNFLSHHGRKRIKEEMSGGLQGLKLEVKHIQKVFPKSHDFFRTVSASLDDLTFHFIQENGEKQVVSCNITVSCQAFLGWN